MKYIASAALVFALFAINGSEFFHHHNDVNGDDSKCEACLFNKVVQSSSIADAATDLKIFHTYSEFLTEEAQSLIQNYYSNSSGRSPPEASHI